MSFYGNFLKERITEVSVGRDLIRQYVRQLFRRADFPQQTFVALEDSTIVNKGDLVWANIDCEHPYDFIPIPRMDDLVLNLPTKGEFLAKLGAAKLEEVTPEAEARFWEEFEFEFADNAGGVKLIWE
ncbi:MAG: hypothetical protein JSW39_25545 [Desulfobacterales bacterium]|nr:MAG: hypothetical protein JSW39_25545 [Desulfobacterales bacterium]